MKLERITIEHFRQYFDRQRVEFARDKERRVTVINGLNGSGKTSLFLALNWCLYGRSVENVRVVEDVGELISKEAIRRARVGDRVSAFVELTFLHNGDRYLVRRTLQATKKADGTIEPAAADDFMMMRTRSDGQGERVNNPVGTMNSILPVNAREYFLFDGERIDNFAKPEASAQVKEAIYLVLKLEILERGRRHLEAAAQDYRKELKRISGGELKNLLERDESARAERGKAEGRKSELEQEIASARRKIEDIDGRLREMQNARSLQQQRDGIERNLKQWRSDIENLVGQIRELATSGYFMAAQSFVERALAVLDEKRERGEIPSSIRKQFVQDLLDQLRCICGRPVMPGGAEYERLRNLMNSSLPSSLEDDILDTSASLRAFPEHILAGRRALDSLMRRRAELVDLIKELEAELDDVGRQLKGSPLEEVSRLERQRQGFSADIESYTLETGALVERIEILTSEISDLQTEINKARKAELREQLLSEKLDLAQRSADTIGEMYQVFADDMRKKIEEKTKEIFQQLIWKDSHFQDVQLGSDFNLEVIDRYGMPARPELSAGERQILSLSFITAMGRTSDEEAPLVMDTPFGRLSSQHRSNITARLPELADQLVLFVTDEELHDQARRNLEPRIGAEYILEFNQATSCTNIVEVKR